MCDAVHIDPTTHKHYILGTFSNIRVKKFPAAHPRMFWFITVTDVSAGEHILKISMGLPMEESKTLVQHKFESKSPHHNINLINEIKNLPFPQPGSYGIHVEIDDETLFVATLNASS